MVFDYMVLVQTANLLAFSLGSLYLLMSYAKQRSEKKATLIVFILSFVVGIMAIVGEFPARNWPSAIIISALLCPFVLSFLYPKQYIQKIRFLDLCLYVSFFWWIVLLYVDWTSSSLYWLLLFPTLGIILLATPKVRKSTWSRAFAYGGHILTMIGIGFYSYFYLTEKYSLPLGELLSRQISVIDIFLIGIITTRIVLLATNLVQFLPIWGGKSHPITKDEFRRVKKYSLFVSSAIDITAPTTIEWVFFGGMFFTITVLMLFYPNVPLILTLLVMHETFGERLSGNPLIIRNLRGWFQKRSQPAS